MTFLSSGGSHRATAKHLPRHWLKSDELRNASGRGLVARYKDVLAAEPLTFNLITLGAGSAFGVYTYVSIYTSVYIYIYAYVCI